MSIDAPITEYLSDWESGDKKARDRIFSLMYDEIRDIARHQRRQWNGNHTVNTTALVHDVYEKLAKQSRLRAEDRTHFMRLISKAMRHILIDYAKKKSRQKRLQDKDKAPLHDLQDFLPVDTQADELIDIDRALEKLEEMDERLATVVEMHFFAGYTYQEIGDALGLSKQTISRDWKKARAILHRELREDASDESDEEGPDK
jgi:RNA polymerase sigma factor (TIGR02999 family)